MTLHFLQFSHNCTHSIADPNEVRCLERYREDLDWPKIELSNSVPCPCSIQQLRLDGRFRLIYQYYDESNNVECYYNRFSQLHQSMCCYRSVISIIIAGNISLFMTWCLIRSYINKTMQFVVIIVFMLSYIYCVGMKLVHDQSICFDMLISHQRKIVLLLGRFWL